MKSEFGDPDPNSASPEANVDWLKWLDDRMRAEIAKVGERVDKHTEFVKDSLLLTFKLVAGGVVLIVALLALIGIKNWFDVTDRVQKALEGRYDQTEKELVQHITDRGLIASYSLQMAAAKTGILRSPQPMSTSDLQKVLDVISNPTSDMPFFDICTQLLISSASNINAAAVDNTIAELVKAQDKNSWMRRSPRKWSQIILVASERGNEEVKPLIRKYISDSDIPGEVRLSAIEFAVNVNLNDSEILAAIRSVYRASPWGAAASPEGR
jgi:hypothetical protein